MEGNFIGDVTVTSDDDGDDERERVRERIKHNKYGFYVSVPLEVSNTNVTITSPLYTCPPNLHHTYLLPL